MEKLLKCGTIILYDNIDKHIITAKNWQSNNGYIFHTENVGGKLARKYLHRVIMDAPNGLVVDHINGNPSDNRRGNLRICTTADNLRNKSKPRTASLSRFIGVKPRCGKFEANIGKGIEYEYLGTFKSEVDAAIAYNIAATRKYGEFAKLNEIPFDYSKYTPKRITGTSRYRGVSFVKTAGKWTASIQVNKKRRRIGYFTDETTAALAYNVEAKRLLGDKAKLNVIDALLTENHDITAK